MPHSRRRFVSTSTGFIIGTSFATLFTRKLQASGLRRGPILDLPEGFQVKVISKKGDDMNDGYRVPGRPDGMACFPGAGGKVVLMRNHEVSLGDYDNGPYKRGQRASDEAYDSEGMGGVSRLVVDPATLGVEESHMVLMGTARNCAGGMSPWGWLTCEETLDEGHGYVFLCDTEASRVQAPRRIDGYGRYNHEAAAVDPRTLYAYLTEDRSDGSFYRFVPASRSNPFKGTLQAMKVRGASEFNTSEDMPIGQTLQVEWVAIDNPTPHEDSVRHQAQGQGAAIVKRGEGIWYHEGQVYFSATSGGRAGLGQIFRYTPSMDEGAGHLTLIAESQSRREFDYPDNITVAPWGDLYMAEDGGGDQYVRILKPDGRVVDFARNALSDSEFAGVCFDPAGKVMFVNIQGDGLTLAVTGPFRTL